MNIRSFVVFKYYVVPGGVSCCKCLYACVSEWINLIMLPECCLPLESRL